MLVKEATDVHLLLTKVYTRARLRHVTTLGLAGLDQNTSTTLNTVFLLFSVEMALKIKVNDYHFQYQPRVYQDAYLVILAKSFHADKVKFTNRWTDGQAQAPTIPLRPQRPRGKNPIFKIAATFPKQRHRVYYRYLKTGVTQTHD